MATNTQTQFDTETLLEAIAEAGERLHVLRQLEATGTMGELDAVQVAKENGLDPETASAEEVAKTFVKSFDLYVEETTTEDDRDEWLASLEDRYGQKADEILGDE